jgi:hypothetical protein
LSRGSSHWTLPWRKQDSNHWSPVRGDNLRRNLALVEELKALAAALAARQISAGYAAKGGWGAVMAVSLGRPPIKAQCTTGKEHRIKR